MINKRRNIILAIVSGSSLMSFVSFMKLKDNNKISKYDSIISNYINTIPFKKNLFISEIDKFLKFNYIKNLDNSIEKVIANNKDVLLNKSISYIFEEVYKNDFKKNKTVNLDGWILSESEVVLLALSKKYKNVYR